MEQDAQDVRGPLVPHHLHERTNGPRTGQLHDQAVEGVSAGTHGVPYLSFEQAADITEQSDADDPPAVSDGSLPAYKFGPRHIRIKLKALEAMARRIGSARS